MVIIGSCQSRQDVLPLLNDDLALGEKLIYGGTQFRFGRIQLHTQELVVHLDNVKGLLLPFGGQDIEAIKEYLTVLAKLHIQPELSLPRSGGDQRSTLYTWRSIWLEFLLYILQVLIADFHSVN